MAIVTIAATPAVINHLRMLYLLSKINGLSSTTVVWGKATYQRMSERNRRNQIMASMIFSDYDIKAPVPDCEVFQTRRTL
jgi:hypothetical protein